MKEVQKKFESKIGTIYICATDKVLTRVLWHEQDVPFISEKENKRESDLIEKAYFQITEYLLGKRKSFDLPLFYKGTEFQEDVWSELKKIPYGEKSTYSKIAIKVNRPKAVRAVGSANGRNPLSIIIPCHRVVGKSGKLSGYAGGEHIKARLLELEESF